MQTVSRRPSREGTLRCDEGRVWAYLEHLRVGNLCSDAVVWWEEEEEEAEEGRGSLGASSLAKSPHYLLLVTFLSPLSPRSSRLAYALSGVKLAGGNAQV